MLAAALFLAAADARCAKVEFCPSDAELVAAVQRREADHMAQLKRQSPDSIVSVPPILAITDVYCGPPLNDGEKTNCRFTLRYPHRISYRIAALSNADGVWAIGEQLAVNRDTE